MTQPDLTEHFKQAVTDGDADGLRKLLTENDSLRQQISEPLFSFGKPAIVQAKDNLATLDVLIEFGADINARSDWDAGSYGVLDGTAPEIAEELIKRGATLDVHSAVELGKFDEVKRFIEADPALVNAKGPDGQRPLHLAKTTEIMDYLLANGAEVNARCVDHNATPAMYAVNDPKKLRYLVDHGAETDIFIGAVLGDVDIIKKALAANPDALATYIANLDVEKEGDIYKYALGYQTRPLHLAAKHGHDAAVTFMLQHATPGQALLLACYRADEDAARAVLADHPTLIAELAPHDRAYICDVVWDDNLDALKVMLNVGFDVNTQDADNATPLFRAAVRGYTHMIDTLLEKGADVDKFSDYGPVMEGCVWGDLYFRDPKGDYPATTQKLLDAGASVTDWSKEVMRGEVAEVVRRHLGKSD